MSTIRKSVLSVALTGAIALATLFMGLRPAEAVSRVASDHVDDLFELLEEIVEEVGDGIGPGEEPSYGMIQDAVEGHASQLSTLGGEIRDALGTSERTYVITFDSRGLCFHPGRADQPSKCVKPETGVAKFDDAFGCGLAVAGTIIGVGLSIAFPPASPGVIWWIGSISGAIVGGASTGYSCLQ